VAFKRRAVPWMRVSPAYLVFSGVGILAQPPVISFIADAASHLYARSVMLGLSLPEGEINPAHLGHVVVFSALGRR